MSTDQDPQAAPLGGSGMSQKARWGLSLTAAVLVLWFLFAWLVLDRHILDAAGESVGTAFALGILASVLGAMRGSR